MGWQSERLRRKASGSLATEVTQSTTSVTSMQPSESKHEGKKDLHYGRWGACSSPSQVEDLNCIIAP